MLHTIELKPGTLHAHYNTALPPILEVDSGDVVRSPTIDVSWGMEPPTSLTAPRRKFEPRDASGPAMVGPITVRGAMPGDTLEIQILTVQPVAWGWTYSGKGMGNPALNAAVGVGDELALTRWRIDHDRGVAVSEFGHAVKLRPFLGIVGVSPGGEGVHSGWRAGAWGGNMDCRELVAGTSLFVPVLAPGARVTFGDGHAAQGDGEVSGTAIECPMERVELRLVLRRDIHLTAPRARTPRGDWVTMGFGDTLDDAAHNAVAGMVDLIVEMYGLSRPHALALASAAANLRTTQIVNGVRGAHAVLEHDAVERE